MTATSETPVHGVQTSGRGVSDVGNAREDQCFSSTEHAPYSKTIIESDGNLLCNAKGIIMRSIAKDHEISTMRGWLKWCLFAERGMTET